MHVCLCVSGRSVCSVEGKGMSSTLLGSPRQQLVSFIHAFFVNKHFFCERPARVPGPHWGAGASLGRSTHPFLPWRNSQSGEEPDQEKHKAIHSGKWVFWKRHWIW